MVERRTFRRQPAEIASAGAGFGAPLDRPLVKDALIVSVDRAHGVEQPLADAGGRSLANGQAHTETDKRHTRYPL